MLKLVNKSMAKKTTNCAVTYRAGGQDKFATCPISCSLKPDASAGASKIDIEYLNAVSDAVPAGGVSFTYSHFNPKYWKHKLKLGKTTINYSAKNLTDLLLHSFVPAVINVKETFWNNKNHKKFQVNKLSDAQLNIQVLIVVLAVMVNHYVHGWIDYMQLVLLIMGLIRKKLAMKMKTAVVMQLAVMLIYIGRPRH